MPVDTSSLDRSEDEGDLNQSRYSGSRKREEYKEICFSSGSACSGEESGLTRVANPYGYCQRNTS